MFNFLKNLFQSRTFGAARSLKWRDVRSEFMRTHLTCVVCGKKGTLLKPNEVHHIFPFHLDKDKELDFQNLITVCRDHHFFCGHLNSWRSFNANIKQDAEQWLNKIKNRP